MDQELIAYFDARFQETAQQIGQQIGSLREETTRRFDQMDRRFEKVEETSHHTLILMEGLRDQVRIIAECMMGLSERLERYHNEVSFERMKDWFEPYFKSLDSRVRLLENRAERQEGDVMDAVRKMLGKPPLSPPITSD